jgi:hypothetical protein
VHATVATPLRAHKPASKRPLIPLTREELLCPASQSQMVHKLQQLLEKARALARMGVPRSELLCCWNLNPQFFKVMFVRNSARGSVLRAVHNNR